MICPWVASRAARENNGGGARGARLHLSYTLLFTESLQATMAAGAKETATCCFRRVPLAALVELLHLPTGPNPLLTTYWSESTLSP